MSGKTLRTFTKRSPSLTHKPVRSSWDTIERVAARRHCWAARSAGGARYSPKMKVSNTKTLPMDSNPSRKRPVDKPEARSTVISE